MDIQGWQVLRTADIGAWIIAVSDNGLWHKYFDETLVRPPRKVPRFSVLDC